MAALTRSPVERIRSVHPCVKFAAPLNLSVHASRLKFRFTPTPPIPIPASGPRRRLPGTAAAGGKGSYRKLPHALQCLSIRIVAAHRQSKVDAQPNAFPDDCRFGRDAEEGARILNLPVPSTPALVARSASFSNWARYSGRQSGYPDKSTALAPMNRSKAPRTSGPDPSRDGKENRVAGRKVRYRDAGRHRFESALFRDVDSVGKCQTPQFSGGQLGRCEMIGGAQLGESSVAAASSSHRWALTVVETQSA